MPTTRISQNARDTLRRLAEESGRTQQEILDEAVERLRRERFLEDLNRAFAELRSDPDRWREELDERRVWDATVGDDLEDEEAGER